MQTHCDDAVALLNEDLLTLNQARKEPAFKNLNTGRAASLEKIYRLVARGVGSPAVRLEAVRLPAGFCTSRQAIQRFVERLTHQAMPEPLTGPSRSSPTATRRRARAADGVLDSAGI